MRIRCRRRHLARHLVGRPAAQHGREGGGAGEGLELEDAPDEAGAVEAAGRRLAERLLRRLGRAAPDVRIADERDGSGQHLPLDVGELGQGEHLGLRANPVLLPAGEVEQAGERVRGLGARRRVVEAELERVVGCGVVEAEAEQAGDRLGACAGLRRQARIPERRRHRAGGVAQAEEADECCVELADRDGAAGNDDAIPVGDHRLLAVGLVVFVAGVFDGERERLERAAERLLRQRPLRLEAGDGVGEQARFDDGLDLRLRPRAVGPRGSGGDGQSAKDDGSETAHDWLYRQRSFPP